MLRLAAFCSLLAACGAPGTGVPDAGADVLEERGEDGARAQDVAADASAPDARPDSARPDVGPDVPVPDAGPDACVPIAETCNGLDDNCNGAVDEGGNLCPSGMVCAQGSCR